MTDISTHIRTRIRELRKKKGYTQEKLAFEASLATSYVSEIERGKKIPTILTLDKIVTALNVSYAELYAFSYYHSGAQEELMAHKIAYEMRDCSPQEQEAIFGLIKQMLELKRSQ